MTEYHYAALTGGLSRVKDGVEEKVSGWAAHHELMAEFLELRRTEKITLSRTETYGHALFHGHSGRVDIYA